MDTLVDAAWLAAHLDDPDLVVLDCRVAMGPNGPRAAREEYRNAHIPGAVYADLRNELSDTSAPILFAVPSPDAFCAALGELGVGDDSRVVLYDDQVEMPGLRASSIWAARVWWMLRWVGFDRAALLDGGLTAWRESGGPVVGGDEHPSPLMLTPRPRTGLVVDRDDVLAAVGTDAVALVDTLTAASYDGSTSMYARPGHITGAVNVPVFDLFDDAGRFLPVERLAERLAGLDDRRVITYCGGGIAASATAFALARCGHRDVGVYTASLQEWAADPSLPMTTGADPGS